MKKIFSALVLMCIAGTVYGQTFGIVECNGRTSVSSWEAPDSIVVAYQLPCGQEVVIIGEEKGYIKILIQNKYYAYLKPEYIRVLSDKKIDQDVISDARFLPPDITEQKVPDKTLPPIVLDDQAAPEAPQVAEAQDVFKSILSSGWEIGLNSSYIKYKEPGYMQEDGITLSLYGNYTFRPNHFMIRFNGRMGFAGMDYDSSLSGEAGRIRDYIVEAGARAGHTFQVTDRWFLTPFAGFGYRYLFDGFGEKITSNGDLGYNRKSNYIFSPIGVESGHSLTPEWAVVASIEYDHFWHGWQHSELGALFGSDYTAINDQTEGWGLQGSGKFVKELGKYNIILGPFFKYWSIEDSDTIYETIGDIDLWLMEPANTSIEIGGMFGVAF